MPSAINGTIPATNAALVSAPVRTNFATAASEITALQAQVGTTGPYLAIGVPQPGNPAPASGTVTSNQLAVSANTAVTGGGSDPVALVGLNIYNDASGSPHYIANGAGGFIDTHTLGTGVARMSFTVVDVNNAGPGASPGTTIGALQIVYGPPGGIPTPFVVVGGGFQIPTTIFPRQGSLIVGDFTVRPDPLAPNADRVSRIGLNGIQDNAGTSWYYAGAGPSGSLTVHDPATGAFVLPFTSMRFSVQEPGTMGQAMGNAPKFVIFTDAGVGANQTGIMIMCNGNSGTPTLQQVTLGAPDSGGAGFRHLIVPN